MAHPSLIQLIERRTMRTLTMETSLEGNLAKCHSQDQSPLYNGLPKEIRDMIFSFATAPFEDLDRAYSVDERYYRPGHRAPHKVFTNLLLTCRKVWLETNALPMRQFSHTFWYGMGPPQSRMAWECSWTTLNKQTVKKVHLFLQLCNAEDMINPERLYYFIGPLKPKTLKITIRHSDWWHWESHSRLQFNKEKWVQSMLNTANYWCENVELELEVLSSEREQLGPIVDKIKNLESCPRPSSISTFETSKSRIFERDGRHMSKESSIGPDKTSETYLSNTGSDCSCWHWIGSAKLKGDPQNAGEEYSIPHEGLPELKYYVEVITWRSMHRAVDIKDQPPDQPPDPSPSQSRAAMSSRHPWSAVSHRSWSPTLSLPQQTPVPTNPILAHRNIPRLGGFRPSRHRPFIQIPFMKNPDQRERMMRGGWHRYQFPLMEDHVRYTSMEAAQDTEARRRELFDFTFAEVAAKDLREKWKQQNSLLRFEE